MVDLGGSLAVASRGLFATGVSTDLNGMFFPSLKFWSKGFGEKVLMGVCSDLFEFRGKDWG